MDEEPKRGADRSLSVQANWRACWVTQPPLGFAVQPARCTRRLESSMKKSTYSRCSRTVSTVKKSTASMLYACARRNARQERPARLPAGPRPANLRISHGGGRDRDAEAA